MKRYNNVFLPLTLLIIMFALVIGLIALGVFDSATHLLKKEPAVKTEHKNDSERIFHDGSGEVKYTAESKEFTFEWPSYDGKNEFSISVEINEGVYDYYHSRMRYDDDQFDKYLDDNDNDQIVSSIRDQLVELYDANNYSDVEKVKETVNFVHHIAGSVIADGEGSEETAEDDKPVINDDWPKFACETLYEQTGDRDDQTILCAALLKKLGKAIIFVKTDDHCALAIALDDMPEGTFYEHNGQKYYHIEIQEQDIVIGQAPADLNRDNVRLIDA